MAGRKKGKTAAGEDGVSVKRTIGLSAETDIKLGVLARKQGVSRSVLAEKILANALRGVVISFRGDLADPGDPTPALPVGDGGKGSGGG